MNPKSQIAELGAPAGAKPTILLVDDEIAIRESVQRVLRGENLRFLEAGDGQQALRVAHENHIDMVLLDLQMPRMDGVEFLKRFRDPQCHPVTPVCVMTANSQNGTRQWVNDLGADDFIPKPMEIVELKTRIRSLLRIGRYQRQLHDSNKRLEKRVVERTCQLQTTVAELSASQQETSLAYREMVLRLSLAAEMKDRCTAAHLERMSQYSALLARKSGWSVALSDLLVDAAKMHDIGKVGIPDKILNKPGKLTKSEFAIIQQHTEIGARILAGSESQLMQMAAEIALTHHERFDGSGYPRGLRGNEIPEVGRIVAIADVFDALMSRRPYKNAWSLDATLDTLKSETGSHFDPRLIDLFLAEIDTVCAIHDTFTDDTTATLLAEPVGARFTIPCSW